MLDGKRLCETAEHLFGKKTQLDSFHQEVATHFYPERADFTTKFVLGQDYAGDLTTSYPPQIRQELGNQLAMMLRPKTRQWFHIAKLGGQEVSHQGKLTLEHFEGTMRRAMYDQKSQMTKSCRVADQDFATFGQAVLSIEPNLAGNRLLYRAWHLRDCAWQENEEGQVGFFVRKWKPTLRQAFDTFGDRLHEKLVSKVDKTPFETCELKHFVVEAQFCEHENPKGRPRFSIWYDEANQHPVEIKPIWGRHYIVPRWVTLNSQYAHSPAVVTALPDARLLQAMMFTLLEVGEKSSNPPLIATTDAVKSSPELYAGGITWIDQDYDERLGEAIRPFPNDYSGVNVGMELNDRIMGMLKEAFYLNKLSPFSPQDPEMTAFQAGQLVQEYVRNAMPIFEPIEEEYNAALCEETFGLMTRMGAFGSPLDWPEELHGMEIEFQFESPLHDAIQREKGQKWLEAQSLIASAAELDPASRHIIDVRVALRDALEGVGVPMDWSRSEDDVEAIVQQEAQMAEMQQTLGAAEQGSVAAKNFAEASSELGPEEVAI